MSSSSLPGLQIVSPLADPKMANFRPDSWPPKPDFPIVIDEVGRIVSRFSDHTWDLTVWAGKVRRWNFGDGPTKGTPLDQKNADVMRLIAAWWLHGPHAVRTVSALVQRLANLKPVFVACSQAGICASELWRYPKVVEQAASRLAKSSASTAISHLHDLFSARAAIGVTILDEAGLRLLARMLPAHRTTQTAYIPPRIWEYQISRLREALDDFHAHREQVEACYRFCLEAYLTNAGGDPSSMRSLKDGRHPFQRNPYPKRQPDYCVFHGPFEETARRFGLEVLFDRWIGSTEKCGVKAITSYMRCITWVGTTYLMNFSLMRIDEAEQLRADCYQIIRDELGDEVHLVRGPTTKTTDDAEAHWIVGSSVQLAVEAMSAIACLRQEAAELDGSLGGGGRANPLLQARSYEPWSSRQVVNARKATMSLAGYLRKWPQVLEEGQLKITGEDLDVANRMTTGLDPLLFLVGKAWPLAWHQLRRTGAVNMLATGMVSELSLQYQLKHATLAMSRYYGQGYYRLRKSLDPEAKGVYLREMYQATARDFMSLHDARQMSPHGDKRKDQILDPVRESDHLALLRSAEQGKISYRQTFLGGCANPGPPCPLGGISNISGCMGYQNVKPCEWVVVDEAKKPMVEALQRELARRRESAEPGSPLWESLGANLESAERALRLVNKHSGYSDGAS